MVGGSGPGLRMPATLPSICVCSQVSFLHENCNSAQKFIWFSSVIYLSKELTFLQYIDI